ncbi:hypothetical protein Z517_06086 [Fonsecaea pedrosoi CBS 271.37]|uniref:Beta-lactamase-related domain-containing protein n=1 Tax=Fonsecaea pedrosoi CBS 271.37 TaxID=1442368 RepID=A0A0D2H4E0_9EURO|nr:uncharacterized protein Z517_06086 [Fonsecaea pedrosoi CBS 271.37]KIW79474.1 hypothetical protein Z517_06086 [Fonsecaea pedrosoi CBS 271.37]
MAELDKILERCTDPKTGTLHGVAFAAVDAQGNILYKKAAGSMCVDKDPTKPLTTNALTWMASMTKMPSSVAAMQLVERGLVGLDDDVRKWLKPLEDVKVLTGFEDGHPVYEEVQGKITLRQLLSHTSGLAYDSLQPTLGKWSDYTQRKETSFTGSIEGLTHPLVFQPGTSWVYGCGLDWAGQVVEAVTGQRFDEYMRQNIWSKLGATSTTFRPWEFQEVLSLPPKQEMAYRADGPHGKGPLTPAVFPHAYPQKDDCGGVGLWSTADDYLKLLGALVAGGAPIFSRPETVDEMFRPQIGEASRAAMNGYINGSFRDLFQILWPEGMEGDHCLAGTVQTEDLPGRRRKGTVCWSGMGNTHWWVDRASGIAGLMFTQLLPTGDISVRETEIELEKALYKAVEAKS